MALLKALCWALIFIIGKTWEETSIQAVSIVKSAENEPTSHLFHRKKIPLQLDAVVTVP